MGNGAMYDRERTLALIEEARRLTSGLKIETQEIGVLIDHAFDEEETDASAGLDEDVEVSRKFKWWFWRW